jgi:O-antigen ligase
MRNLSFCFLLLTIVLLPFYIVRFSITSVPVTLLEMSILATFIIWVIEKTYSCLSSQSSLSCARVHASTYLKGFLPSRWWYLWIGLFLLAATISVFVSSELRQALGVYKAYFLEPLLLFVVILDTVKGWRKWLLVLDSLALSGGVVATLCLTQKLFAWPNFASAELAQHRSSAMFNSANDVGLFLAPISFLVLAFALYDFPRNKKWGFIRLLYVFIYWLAIAFSASRGAAVGLGVALVIGLIVYWLVKNTSQLWRYGKLLIVWSIVIYIVLTSVYMGILNHPPRVLNPYARSGFTTFTVRQCTWQGTVAMLKTTPVFGAGLSGFTDLYLKHYTCDAEPLVYPHNQLLTVWSEIGLLGCVSLFGLIALYLFNCQIWLRNKEVYIFGIAGIMVIIYWLSHGVVDVPYFKNDLSCLWWIVFGLFTVRASNWQQSVKA